MSLHRSAIPSGIRRRDDRARDSADQSLEQARLLADRLERVTTEIARAGTAEETAKIAVAQCVAELGALDGALWLITAGGEHVELMPDGFVRRSLSEPTPLNEAIASGSPIWLESHAEYALRFPKETAGQALACIPMIVRGKPIGAISLAFASNRRFDQGDRRFLEAITRHTAQAIDRARVNETLYRLGVSFAKELDYQRLVQLITDEATALTGAEVGAFFVVVPASGTEQPVETYRLHTISGAARDRFSHLLETITTPLLTKTFGGEGVSRFDDTVSYLATPVVRRAGEVLGCLFFCHSEPGKFTESHERIVSGLSAQAAVALENARLYELAKSADRRKDEFLAMLGHELRNPLAPIVTALHLMRLKDPERLRPERELIERQVRHVERLVDDLLDISRITRGKIKLDVATIEISSTITKAIEMASPLLEQRQHHISLEVPKRGLLVKGDPVRLAQVISNLLTNAAKYTEKGGHISIRALREGEQVAVYVKDNGVGIAPEMLPSIFDLFVQGGRSMDRAEGGLGIGLTLVKNLVGMHGGTVTAMSEGLGKGSELVVRLPIQRDGVAKAETGSFPLMAIDTQRKNGRRVLIVDDNTDAAETLAEVLRAEGHEVAVAFDGPRALAVAEELTPDVAILDLGLPVMDGFELAERLREQQGAGCPRLIAVTGYGQENDRARTNEAGFAAHFVKPVNVTTLITEVEGAGAG